MNYNIILKILIVVVIIIIIIVIAGFIILWSTANSFLFYPEYEMKWFPSCSFENIWINVKNPKRKFILVEEKRVESSCIGIQYPPNTGYSDDGDGDLHELDKRIIVTNPIGHINCWYFNSFKNANTIIFYHGNAGNISQREYVISICNNFKLNLLLVDYRGFGLSPGRPTPEGCCQDGMAAYRYLTEVRDVDANKIIVWGESLGGGVAAHVASKYPCRALILMSTFSSIDDAIRHACGTSYSKNSLSCLASLVPFVIDCLPSKEKLKTMPYTPVCIVHSIEDELINYKCAEILYESIPHQCKLIIPIKGGHSTPDLKAEDLAQMFTFADVSLTRCQLPQMCIIADKLKTIGPSIFPPV